MEKLVLLIGGFLKLITWVDVITVLLLALLILLMVYIIYLIKIEEEGVKVVRPEKEVSLTDQILNQKDKDLKPSDILVQIVDDLNKNYKPEPIDLTKYEEEQENSAIISYDELLERTSNNINYDEEYTNEYDDLFIRKVTEDSDTKEYVNLPEVIMMNYESEEDFLKALKKLQKNLVR